MKIAVMLTGLVIDKTETLPYIKQMFDMFAERNNLQIDYYCHFWSPEDLYPYTIDYHKTRICVPWENAGSIDYALSIFKPKYHRINPFKNLYWNFVDYYDHIAHDDWTKSSAELVKHNIANKELHADWFLNNCDNPQDGFDKWWHYHVWWCRYVHTASQAYSTSQSCEMVHHASMNYAACIKWRYDVIADLVTHNDKIMNAIKQCANQQAFYTELAWEGLEWQQDLPYDINTADANALVSLHDGWWICSLSAVEKLNRTFFHDYITNMKTPSGGQHTHFFKSIKNTNIPIHLTDRIQSNIIRFPKTIPDNFNIRPQDHFDHLYARNFQTKKHSSMRDSLENFNKRSQYYTVGKFNFY